MPRKDPCEGCIYSGYEPVSGHTCDYYLMTGQRRPCKSREGCTVRAEHEKWDTGMARRLFFAGKKDCDIARAVGVSERTIHRWRKKEDLYRGMDPHGGDQNDP